MNDTVPFTIKLEVPLLKKVHTKINNREAVRAVILQDDKILLVQSNKRDFKFPGGGIEGEENHQQALKREVEEETGYINLEVIKTIGKILERKTDEFESDCLFSMNSTYYLCKLINEDKTSIRLNEYEAELDFSPVWVTLDEAIRQNEVLMHKIKRNSWLKRETLVLKRLKAEVLAY
ncbi:NUDIX domain-containing protein [Rossellomorea vietnamensis]|uniref:NUDIX domain-containing protein n=1 Tax=Rossellomorea vietnamensis TaxID=218284 RepID=A0A5D4P186_9BACI|nr:NUDIX domain-containing protein [Rossellomorea vietnamensis]TYS18542.1 NUDIX domain-containing protein [Rossellomorea vietnamensis]